MIIDFHAHCFPDALAARGLKTLVDRVDPKQYKPVTDMTVSGLTSYMDKNGIDLAVLQPVITKLSQLKSTNEWAASVQTDKITAFGGIYPHTDDYKRDIDFVVSLGLKGLKFHAEYQDFVLDSPEMLKIYDYAFSKNLIILHHAGFDPGLPPPFKTSPAQFRHIAQELRGGTMVAAHLGGCKQWDEVLEQLPGTGIYIDTSMGFDFYGTDTFMRAVELIGANKILFASDSPWSDARREADKIISLPLSQEAKDAILYKNAKELLC